VLGQAAIINTRFFINKFIGLNLQLSSLECIVSRKKLLISLINAYFAVRKVVVELIKR